MQYTDDMIRDLPSDMENEVLETVFIEPGSTSVAKTHGPFWIHKLWMVFAFL